MKARVTNSPGPKTTPAKVVRSIPAPDPRLPPVSFFAEADVPSGGEATIRSEALSNRTGRPVEIHEIRLASWFVASGLDLADPGGFTRVRITAGGKPVTNTFIPIWLLGKTEQLFVQSAIGRLGTIYVWRLSRPWFLKSEVPIDVQFQHTGAVRYQTRAQINLAGRYLPRSATTAHIPYAASYVSRPFSYSAADGSGVAFDESSERDLVNITKKPVKIDRMIARVAAAWGEASNITTRYDDFNNSSIGRTTAIRVLTSNNLPIVRDYSRVLDLFGYARSIELPFSISPNDYIRVGVRSLDGPTLVTPFRTYQSQAFVSFLGSREEAV